MTLTTGQAALAIFGMACVTVVTRGFFLIPRRPWPIPAWLQRALQLAPLAALVAVLVPEIVMPDGHLIDTWRNARLAGGLAATLWYVVRPGVLGPLLAGLAAYLPARLLLGW